MTSIPFGDSNSEQRGKIVAVDESRIYLVTDGLKSPSTRRTYRSAFNHFLQVTVKNDDLRLLIDLRPNVIEAKIIAYIEYHVEGYLIAIGH